MSVSQRPARTPGRRREKAGVDLARASLGWFTPCSRRVLSTAGDRPDGPGGRTRREPSGTGAGPGCLDRRGCGTTGGLDRCLRPGPDGVIVS
jgi:hypothetical protein